VLSSGKNQKDLSPGWEVLGLSYEAATQIWENEKKENFMSDRETMYGGQTRKYDKDGRQIKEDGKLVNPDEARPEDNEPSGGGGVTSNVYECGNCGHTLFVAAGRESKFFGDSFTCPECGAPKSDFKARNIEE
jgi:rubredoxin